MQGEIQRRDIYLLFQMNRQISQKSIAHKNNLGSYSVKSDTGN